MPTDEYDDIVAAALAAPTAKKAKSTKAIDYRALYNEVGGKYGVDPDLLYRQAEAESNFNPNARSGAGAAGLSQFMPDTARQYGLHVGKGRDDRFNPRLAADAQARMMRDLLARHKGDTTAALAAYNSGHNKTTQQALRSAERIPETRGYVQKIGKGRLSYDDIVNAGLGTPDADPYADIVDAAVGQRRKPAAPPTPPPQRKLTDPIPSGPQVGRAPGGPENAEAYARAAGRATTDPIRAHLGMATGPRTAPLDVVTPVRQLQTALAQQRSGPAEARRTDNAEVALLQRTAEEVAREGGASDPSTAYRYAYGASPAISAAASHTETLRRFEAKMRQYGSAEEALNADHAAAAAEQARLDRIASMTPAARLGARAAEFATGPARGAVGVVGTSLKGVAAFNQVAPFSITALPGQITNAIVGDDATATTDDPYYKLGEVISNASRAGALNPYPDFETEFVAGRSSEVVGQSAVFLLGGWATGAPRLAVAVLGTAMTAGDTYDEVRALGGNDDDAVFSALIAGSLLGPTELIGLRGAMKVLSGTAREATYRAAFKRALIEGRRDLVENALQEIGQETGQGIITGQHRTAAQLGEAGLLGAVGAGPVTAGLTAISAAPRTSAAPAPTAANTPTVSADLQARLARAELTRPAETTPTQPSYRTEEVAPETPTTATAPEVAPAPEPLVPVQRTPTEPAALAPATQLPEAATTPPGATTAPTPMATSPSTTLDANTALPPPRTIADLMAEREAAAPVAQRDAKPESDDWLTSPTEDAAITAAFNSAEEAARISERPEPDVNQGQLPFGEQAVASTPESTAGPRYQVVRGADAYVLEDTQTPSVRGNKTLKAGRDKAVLDAEAARLNAVEDEQAAAPAEQATEPTAAPAVTASTPTLPRDLAGAKPRYSIGSSQYTLTFASDIDRAAYITAQTKRSKRDADYMKFVVDATGMSPIQVRAHGAAVRAAIKGLAKGAEPGGLTVPAQQRTTHTEPSAITRAREQIADREAFEEEGGEFRGSGGPDTGHLLNKALVRGYDLYTGTVRPKFTEWSRKMTEEFGPAIKEHLRTLWADIQSEARVASTEERNKLADEAREAKEAARIAKLEAFPVPQALMDQAEKIVAARTRYGRRSETPTKSSYRVVWSNGDNGWYVAYYPHKAGEPVSLDANEILIPSNKKTAEAIAHRLPPLPLARLAYENNPAFKEGSSIEGVEDFYQDLADTHRASNLAPAEEITDLGDVETPRLPTTVHDTARTLGAATDFSRAQTEGTGPRTGPGNEYDRTVRALRADFPDWTDAQARAWIKRNRPDLREGGGIGDVQDLGDIDTRRRGGEGGFVDLNEIREGFRAGKLRVEDALEQLRKRFPNATDKRLRAILARADDPLIGIATPDGVEAEENAYRAGTHQLIFKGLRFMPDADHWRYEPITKTIYWNTEATPEREAMVRDYLEKRNLSVENQKLLADYPYMKLWEMEENAFDALQKQLAEPHHATVQPRTLTGQFAPGSPGGLEAEQSLLRTAAREYQRDYGALAEHQARRLGLSVANDDVVGNYFAKLHRFAAAHKPELVDQVHAAEAFYARGKYNDATTLTEQVLSGTHEYINKVSGALASMGLVERGLTPAATNWRQIIADVRAQMKRTGSLTVGGNIYDVTKYPEGGRADHEKLALWLEPIITGLRNDIARLNIKAADRLVYIRTEMNKILADPLFSDWHPINKAAALGVVARELREEGGPPAPPAPPVDTTTGTPQPPKQKERSLPKTLERAGRLPGTDLLYDELPNAKTKAAVEQFIDEVGIDDAEAWYYQAPPSAARTYTMQALVDRIMSQSTKAPTTEAGEALVARAMVITNHELPQSTTLGQAVQAYAMHNKYTPSGALLEATRMAAKAGRELTTAEATELGKQGQIYVSADKALTEAHERVEAAEAELATVGAGPGKGPGAGSGTGAPAGTDATGSRPTRTARPPKKRRSASLLPSKLERAQEARDEAAERRAAAKRHIARMLAEIEQSRTYLGYLRRSSQLTRGLMVSMFQTHMRNAETQAARFGTERLVDIVEDTIRHGIGPANELNRRNIWRNTLRILQRSDKFARQIASEHPEQLARLLNTHAEGMDRVARANIAAIPSPIKRSLERLFVRAEDVVDAINWTNRLQEHHLRAVEFLAELDLHLRADESMTLEQFVKRNGIDKIPMDLVRKSVDKALEVTFAAMPSEDHVGGQIVARLIRIGNYFPPTLSPVTAFPRFMFNSMKFLYQYNPTGIIDVAKSATRNRNIRAEVARIKASKTYTADQKARLVQKAEARTENVQRAIARTLVGSAMLLMAFQFRDSDHAKTPDGQRTKWYELQFGEHTLDTRPLGPFSTYLFLGEAIRRYRAGEKAFTKSEILQALGASTGPGGSAISVSEKLYDQFSNGDFDKAQRLLKTEAGEFGRAILTPVRQVKDLIAEFDASEATARDTNLAPAIGPALESIPFASRAAGLPEAHRPTTAAPIHQEHGGIKAITGVRIQTPKNFVEREIDDLHLAYNEVRANTGNPEIDALEKRLMGPRVEELAAELEADTEYRSSGRAARKTQLKERLSDIRKSVRAEGKEMNPDLYDKHKEDTKPRDEKELEKEQASQGLSAALRLGVPLPIPRMRAGEDDVAYRARLIQTARAQRTALNAVVRRNDFTTLSKAAQRNALHSAVT